MQRIPAREMEQRAYQMGPGMTTADLFRLNAERFGDAQALGDGRNWLSWRQVSERSDAIAADLLEQGFGRADTALLQSANTFDGYLARLALEKAGIRALTLPMTYRDAEIGALMDRIRPTLAMVPDQIRGYPSAETVSRFGEKIPGFRALFTWQSNTAGLSVETLGRTPWEPGMEYWLERFQFRWLERSQIATTSGSTGQPKCVEETIGGRMLTGLEQARIFGIEPGDVIGALSPMISGAADALAYRAAPQLGCRAVLVDSADPSQAIHCLAETRVTVAILVPTMLVRLVRDPDFTHTRLPDLRLLVSYGAPLPIQAAVGAEEQTHARVVQAYGSVDFGGIAATPVAASRKVRFSTVGEVLRGDEVCILDASGREQPSGQTGYVSVRGIHATATYWGENRVMREQWRYGFYRVGELGYFDDEHHLVLIGRERDIIIRGGQNIAASEVEYWLREHPDIEDVAVVGIPDVEMGERVGAGIICGSAAITLDGLRSFFRQKGVALFKCPERLVILEQFPMVANGIKIDKNALKKRLMESR